MTASQDIPMSTPLQCPICHRPVPDGAKTTPFCSSRCQQVDLVRWADGKYALRRELTQDDLEEFPEADLAGGGDAAQDVS